MKGERPSPNPPLSLLSQRLSPPLFTSTTTNLLRYYHYYYKD